MMQTSFSDDEIKAIFNRLARCLASQALPMYKDAPAVHYRHPSACEFMLMHKKGHTYAFKHHETKNYIYLTGNRINLGDGISPFQKHEFVKDLSDLYKLGVR